MLRKSLANTFLLIIAISMSSPGCENGSDISSEACAMYTSCIDRDNSLGECISILKTRLPTEYRHISNVFVPGYVSLSQNLRCIADSQGDCDKVLACLNRGEVVAGCSHGFECVDSNAMSVCLDFNGVEYSRAEHTIRCGDLGLSCVKSSEEEHAFCGLPESQYTDQVIVTCDGDTAKMHYDDVSILIDCSLKGSKCNPGTHPVGEGVDPCIGTGASCDELSFTNRCDGNTLTVCIADKESSIDCESYDLSCRQTASSRCNFKGCLAADYTEQCDGGTITYCGPEGEAKLSCKELGFSGCNDEPVIGVHCIN